MTRDSLRLPGVDERTAPLLVLAGALSVQFGGALAATLVPKIGAPGSVLLRLGFSSVILWVFARPRWRGRTRRDWLTVIGFGLALAGMNTSFYASLAHLPIGVAVTIEFLGPLLLAAVLSRRARDLLAVGAAAFGVVLVSGALNTDWASLPVAGIVFAAIAGALWAAYILLSQRTGKSFAGVEGLAIALVVSTVVVAPFGAGSISSWTPAILALGLGIAILSSVLPYSMELVALRFLSPQAFGIMLALEPAIAALAGLLVLHQRLDALQLVGMALVVLAGALVLGARRPAEQALLTDPDTPGPLG